MSSSALPLLSPRPARLAWIDWMRGLACLLMFQTHCYDAWLGGNARNTPFIQTSQLLGTLPAPLFLFLAGISFALVLQSMLRKPISPGAITRAMLRRGAEIFAFGLLFRVQEFAIAWGWAPWSDLFRVDVLNIIGLSMMLMALLCGLVLLGAQPHTASSRLKSLAGSAVAAAALVALLTPPLYTTWRPTWLPWPLESYINGCHNLGSPQPWLFPLFPWAAFAFSGLATGFILFRDNLQAPDRAFKTFALFAGLGAAAILASYLFDHSSLHLYSTYDYWHTSPNFLLIRVGILLLITFLTYCWCRWGLATRGFSPVLQLGQTSLLVYWVHIELVYGRFSLLPKRAQSIPTATRGLFEIIALMLVLSLLRTRVQWKNIFATLRTPSRIQPV